MLYVPARAEHRRGRSSRGAQEYQNRPIKCLWDVVLRCRMVGKISVTVLYAIRSFDPLLSSRSGYRSTEGVIFRSCPMVAESSLLMSINDLKSSIGVLTLNIVKEWKTNTTCCIFIFSKGHIVSLSIINVN